jgi:ABC-type multidrug transport system fused ATPase/permease subunit
LAGRKGTRQRGPDHQVVPPRAGARRRVAEPLRRFRQGRHQASPAPDSFHAANDLIFGVENGAAIYLGAQLAIEGALTVGILFTYMSYKRQILEKVARLIEMLDLYLERLRRKIFFATFCGKSPCKPEIL